jgi:signal recognition particle GTPase
VHVLHWALAGKLDVNALVEKFTAAQKMMKQIRNGGGIT